MKKKLATLTFVLLSTLAPFAAMAADLPDGPVASPPGWSCSAKGGKVTCVQR